MLIQKFKIYRYLITLSIFLVACKPATTTSQPSVISQPKPTKFQTISYVELLKNPECSLPCWNGIEVDKTSFKRAKEILINKYGVENVAGSDEKDLEWKAHGVDRVNDGYISFYNGTVSEIFLFFERNAGPSVDNLISVLGEPTWIFVSSQPNDICRGFEVIYPTFGLYGDMDISEGQKDIQPSNQILMLRFLQTKISENMQVNDGYLVKWDGYKNYCEN